MPKPLQNLILALTIAAASAACAIVPAPHYGYREPRVEFVNLRPVPYYAPAPRYLAPQYHEEHRHEHFRHDRD